MSRLIVTALVNWLSRYCAAAMIAVLKAAGALATLASQVILMTKGEMVLDLPVAVVVAMGAVVSVVPLLPVALAVLASPYRPSRRMAGAAMADTPVRCWSAPSAPR